MNARDRNGERRGLCARLRAGLRSAIAPGAVGAACAVVVSAAALVAVAVLPGRAPVASGGPRPAGTTRASGPLEVSVIRVSPAGRPLEVIAGAQRVRVCLVRPRRCVEASRSALRSGSPDAVVARLDDRPSLLLALLPAPRVPIGPRWTAVLLPGLRARVVVAAVDPAAGAVCLAYRGPAGRSGRLAVTRTVRAGVGLLVRRSPCERAAVGADPGGVHEPRDHDQP